VNWCRPKVNVLRVGSAGGGSEMEHVVRAAVAGLGTFDIVFGETGRTSVVDTAAAQKARSDELASIAM
jgi:hypothetical protein